MKKLINKYQVGGWFPIGYDDNVYRASYTLPEIKIQSNRPEWQNNLNDYDLARLKSGQINAETAKSIAQKRVSGTSGYMKDVNKLALLPNGAMLLAGGLSGALANPYLLGAIGLGSAAQNIEDKNYKEAVLDVGLTFLGPELRLLNKGIEATRFGKSARIAAELSKAIKSSKPDFTDYTLQNFINNFNPNKYLEITPIKSNYTIPTVDEITHPGMQFIRALSDVPRVNDAGFVELVPEDNMLANFATDMRAASHHHYKNLYEMPSLIFVDESRLKGATPLSIEPSDTFFRAFELKNKLKPEDVTFWSFDEATNAKAKQLGFNVKETPQELIQAHNEHLNTIKPSRFSLKRTEKEKGDYILGNKVDKLRRNFEQTLYRRPTLEDYKRLESKTNLQSGVVQSDISKLENVIKEYKDTQGNISKIEGLYKKYGDNPIVTLNDGTTFGHDDLVTLSFGDENTISDRLAEMINANVDSRYTNIYYDKASPIEAKLMKSIGMGQHPKLINGRVKGAKGVGNMSLEEFNEALNNLRKRLGAKPLAKGGKLI